MDIAGSLQTMRFDRPTVMAGGLVLALMSAIFVALSALPEGLGFVGQVAEIFAPLVCVPAFVKFRERLAASRAALIGSAAAIRPVGYQFLAFAVIATLLLTFLAELFNMVSIVQKQFLLEQMRTAGVALDDAAIATWSGHGDGVVVLPLLFLAAFAVGAAIHVRRIARPWACLLALFCLSLLVRALYVFGKPSLRDGLIAFETDLPLWSVFMLALAVWPIVIALGSVSGYLAARVASWGARVARALFGRDDGAPPAPPVEAGASA
jgi:hypothetical protein